MKNMSARQFRKWQHYAEIEPFGELREDYRAASIREMVYNMAVSKEDRKPLKDFLLKFDKPDDVQPAEQTDAVPWQHLKTKAMWIAMAYGAQAKDV